jgi:hypothetical protein
MVATAATLVAFPGKATLGLMLAVDNCFLAYVGLVVRWRDARMPKVAAPVPAPELVLTPASVRPVLSAG